MCRAATQVGARPSLASGTDKGRYRRPETSGQGDEILRQWNASHNYPA